jgi:hypothetical protein
VEVPNLSLKSRTLVRSHGGVLYQELNPKQKNAKGGFAKFPTYQTADCGQKGFIPTGGAKI